MMVHIDVQPYHTLENTVAPAQTVSLGALPSLLHFESASVSSIHPCSEETDLRRSGFGQLTVEASSPLFL